MKIASFFVVLATLLLASAAQAGTYMSAHFCQPYKNGGTPTVELYYQNQGSILAAGAAGSQTSVSCPLQYANGFPTNVQVALFYSTQGVNVANPIRCRLWKINSVNLTLVGQEVQGLANQASGQLFVTNGQNQSGTIGGNVECWLAPGAKILGYEIR